jgi:hypothetical protein
MSNTDASWNFPHISGVKTRSSADDRLFQELHDVLERHGALNRFGVALLHTHFPVAAGEVMMEETDVLGRRQTTRPVFASSLDPDDTIETLWSLESGRPIMRCTCQKYDDGHNHFESNRWPI